MAMQATLTLASETEAAIRKHYLKQFPVVLGRGLEADIRIADRSVSRTHCEIALRDGTLIVEDLQSNNGTLVNGCPVAEAPLMPGDQLMLGTHVYRVAYERSSLNPPPPIIYGREPASRNDSHGTTQWV